MRIAAVLTVKDEIELIERSITHLRQIGIDEIVACDKGSTDGTREVLEAFRRDDDFQIVEVGEDESHEAWVGKNLAVVDQSDVDWVTFLDADEFLVPASGLLKECAALATADAVTIERFNVPLSPAGLLMPDELTPAHYDELLVVADPIRDFWAEIDRRPEASWMYARVAPRFLAKHRRIERVGIGGHNIFPSGSAPLRRATASDAFVAHAPMTTWERFARKAENIRNLLAVHDESFGEARALHWRRWAAQAENGSLREEFSRMIFGAETIAELRDRSVIRSATELFGDRLKAVGAA